MNSQIECLTPDELREFFDALGGEIHCALDGLENENDKD